MSPARLSVARAVEVRRSEVSVIDGRQPSTRQPNDLQSSTLLADPSPPRVMSSELPNPHFAPLNRIGTTYARNNPRPNLGRNPSSGGVSTWSRPSHEGLRPPDAYCKAHTRPPSPGLLPPIPRGGPDWGGRFTLAHYQKEESDRHSDVSSLSDEEEHYNRRSHQPHMLSPIHGGGSVQPFRII